jgi:3-phosphoshikimate 1-carboxyvinyltransferase
VEQDTLPPAPRPPRTVFVRGPNPGARRDTLWAPTLTGSKYYTLRYLLNALLADSESFVRHPAVSDDTTVLLRAMRLLGAEVAWEPMPPEGGGWQVRVHGVGGRPRTPPGGVIQVGNAGAVLRLLLGIGALLPEVRFVTDHPDSLGRRPNADLLAALAVLGVGVTAVGSQGLLPIMLRAGDVQGGTVAISGTQSSQYLSALLYLAPLLPLGLTIDVIGGLRSAPLVRVTLRALAAAGIRYEAAPDLRRFVVPGGQVFSPRVYDVPGDGPTAAALAAAALVADVPLRLERLSREEDDVRALLAALRALGAELNTTLGNAEHGGGDTLLMGSGARLRGARIDGDACIDSVPALVAPACFAEGESRFENVVTLRLKESDRIGDLSAELRRAGCDVAPLPDAILVRGRPEGIPGGVTVAGHDDHRLVQALAIVALRSRDGLTITGADAVAKSYPAFFDDLTRLGAEVRAIEG